MRTSWISVVAAVVVVVLSRAAPVAASGKDFVGTAFTYQGVLKVNGVPVDGTYDFEVSLWDSSTGGTRIGTPIQRTGVIVERGLVNLDLDFGLNLGTDAVWLEIAVRENGAADWTVLSPRQRLNPAPQAVSSVYAVSSEDLGGHGADYFLDTSENEQQKDGRLTVVANNGTSTTILGALLDTNTVTGIYAGIDGIPFDKKSYGGKFSNSAGPTLVTLAGPYYGVYGSSQYGPGISGHSESLCGVEGFSSGRSKGGVWGRNDSQDGGYGVVGVGTFSGGYFYHSTASGYAYIGKGDTGVEAFGDWMGGMFTNSAEGTSASLAYSTYAISGTGTKNFIQNDPEDAASVVVYTALEGPTVDTYTRGTARVRGGEVRIPLDPTFRLVTNPEIGLTAVVTPRGPAPVLYVRELTTDELVVACDDPGADVVFDYVVYGLRIGFEDVPAIQPKERDAPVPSMRHHETLLASRPELAAVTGRGRFETELAAAGLPPAKSDGRAAALLAAIGRYEGGSVASKRAAAAGDVVEPGTPRPAPRDGVHSGGREASLGASATAGHPASLARPGENEAPAAAVDQEVPEGRVIVRLPGAAQPAGTVMAFDPGAGQAVPAATASDPAVVGIAVDDPRPERGGTVVAVAGVAVCLADATYGAIMPGDLLVASPTPGYAMRAADPMPGAVIAKALEPLDGGTGAIRVLVVSR